MKTFAAAVVFLVAVVVTGGASCLAETIKELDVVYAEIGGQKLLLDVYRPAEKLDKPRAAMLLVHGGAWAAGSKRDFRDIGAMLSATGYITFVINYRLVKADAKNEADANRWPAQLDDAQRAVRWIRANSKKYDVDPERIGALGGSAGGHIVACLGTRDTRDNADAALAKYSSRVQCVVNISGPTDLTDDFSKKVKQGAWANEMVRNLLGGNAKSRIASAGDASPLFAVDKQTAPFFIVHGKTDPIVPVDHAERLDAALRKAGVESQLMLFNGGHEFADGATAIQFALQLMPFLQTHLGPR